MRPSGLSLSILGLVVLSSAASLFHFHRRSAAHEARANQLSRTLAEVRFDAKQLRQETEAANLAAARLDVELGAAKTLATAKRAEADRIAAALLTHEQALAAAHERESALEAELRRLPATTASRPLPAPESTDRRTPEAHYATMLQNALSGPVSPKPIHQVRRVGGNGNFVILDYGSRDGARAGAAVSIVRGTLDVARVQITDAQPGYSIATPVQGTRNAQLQTGDRVVLAK